MKTASTFRSFCTLVACCLALTAGSLAQTTLTITGTVANASCPYAGGSGQATLVSGNGSGTANWLVGTSPVQNPRVIYSLDSFGKFSMTLTNTSSISPGSFDPQWQFSFCSFDYPSSGKICFTMTPMSLTSSQDISTAIQSQSAPIPGCGSGPSSGITFEHNGTVVATEPKYNVDDTGTTIWTVIDDPANQRVTASIAASGGGGGSCPAGSNNDVQINESGVCAVDAGIGTIDPVAHESSENIVNANQQVQVGDTTHSGLIDMCQSNGSSCTGHFQMSLDALTGAGYGIDWPNAAPAAGAALTAIGTTVDSGTGRHNGLRRCRGLCRARTGLRCGSVMLISPRRPLGSQPPPRGTNLAQPCFKAHHHSLIPPPLSCRQYRVLPRQHRI